MVFLSFYSGALLAGDGEALGPFDDIVVRATRVVAGAVGSGRVIAFHGSDGRWLEAEREERRGIASDQLYARHSHLRLHSAERDLMVRFFADDEEDAPMVPGSELGPYVSVTVGPLQLRADGKLLADRPSPGVGWVAHPAPDAQRGASGGAVLAVRSGSVARSGEDARVVPVSPRAVAPVLATTSAAPAFQFVERARVSPRIYITRGTDAQRDP